MVDKHKLFNLQLINKISLYKVSHRIRISGEKLVDKVAIENSWFILVVM